MSSTDDNALIQECLSGRTEAFGALVRKYQDRLYNTLVHVVGNVDDARDAVQDAFIQAYRSLGRFQGNCAFYTWLYRIAINAAISTKRRTRVTVPFDDGRRDLHLDPADDVERTRPELSMEQVETQQQVRMALDSLPADFRAILILKEFEGHRYEVIAEMLNCPVGTVKSRLHRARLELRERLRHLELE